MILYKTNELKDAIKFLKKVIDDFEERIFNVIINWEYDIQYKSKKKISEENNSRIIASLSAHASINLNQDDNYTLKIL